jgi:transposase-like protein
MNLIRRLLGQKSETEVPQADIDAAETECPHTTLVPHWDSAEAMGQTDKISHFECESCKQTFSREDGERLRSEGAERLRVSEEERREHLAE